MAPRIQHQDLMSQTVTVTKEEAPKDYTVRPSKPVIDNASYWDWPSDQVDTKETVIDSPVSSESFSKTAPTEENNSVTSSENHDYWTEECCDHALDTKYFVDYSRNLGKGTKTVVRQCSELKTGKKYAVKSVKKWDAKEMQSMKSEAKVLRRLDHPSILKVQDECQDSKSYHIVSELCQGGEVYEQVVAQAKRHKHVSEDSAARIVQQLVEAIAYCHEKHIVHRDIKLENVLLLKKGTKDTEIRLADFGLAVHHIPGDAPLTDYVGSPNYVAPEVLDQSYDKACDIWSIGVFTFALLCGSAPFVGRSNKDLYENIRTAPLVFPQHVWKNDFSEDAKDFVKACLQKDPKQRPTAEELSQHAWIVNHAASESVGAGKTSRMSKLKRMFRRNQ